jgi:hypothetical protein
MRQSTCLSLDITSACNDDASPACGSAQFASTLSSIPLGSTGGIFYVIVDSYADVSRCGAFQLAATFPP